MTQKILTNAKLVLAGEILAGTIVMEGEKVAEIAPGRTSAAGAIDCGGDFIIPGLIELHTDNLERHIQPRPGVDWPHAAAILAHDGELASTGITTVFDAMRAGSIISGSKSRYGRYARTLANELLDIRARGLLRISHFLHLRAENCSETLIEELAEFNAEDRIGILSLMDHTPGQRQFRDLSKFKAYVCGKHGLSDDEFGEHVEMLYAIRARLGDKHEAATVEAAKRLGAVLASHDDTTAEQVSHSKSLGVGFAEFPTTIEAARACRDQGIAVMMGAPNLIRGGSHSGNVAAEDLAREDLLDILSSDYVPSALLLAAFRLGEIWGDIPSGIATVTRAPANAVGLTDRGTLSAGLNADIVRVAYSGETPAIRGVWARGRQVG